MEENELQSKEPPREYTPEAEEDIAPTRARLIEVLQSLESEIKKQTSLKWAFLRGAIYGLGTVIGATILLALLGGIIAGTLSSLRDLPLIGEYIGNDGVEEYVEKLPPE